MLIALVLMYFLLAGCAGWLLLFPAGRDVMIQSLANLGLRLNRRAGKLNRAGAGHMLHTRRAAGAVLARGWRMVRRHRYLSLAAAISICLPPSLAWLLGEGNALDGYQMNGREVNAQVSELLKGEQLAPPPAPPPLVFVTREAVQLRPLLGEASRSWQLLDHDFGQRLLLVFKIMKESYGVDMVLLEGYRSPARQNRLAAAGPSVSNAKAFQSYHQYGLAADCAFFRDGKLLMSEKDPWAMRNYRLYGSVAESLGLHWGGRWTMLDFGHAELRVPGIVRK